MIRSVHSSLVCVVASLFPLIMEAGEPLRQAPLAPGQVRQIGGFVGDRMLVNKTGAILGLDINKYVGMLEKQDYTQWFWIGEQPGKWLESAILTSRAQEDQELDAKARAVLARMIKAQRPDGYLGITADKLRTEAVPLRGMDPYEQYFTFHALLTAWDVWHDRGALDAAVKLGDYYLSRISEGKAQFWPSPYRPPENINLLICPQVVWRSPEAVKPQKQFDHSEIAGHTAHYGFEGTLVIDPMLRLYEATGERRFLDWSKWVVSKMDVWSGWNSFSKLDQVAAGKLGIHQLQPYVHAHTFQMNFLGLLRLYRATGDASLLRKVEGAWSDIAARQIYITGGVSVGEHYTAGFERPVCGHVVETCANMSWLQLNQALLEITGKPRYADAIERLLFNHVFAAQTIDGDSNRYHSPPNGFKPDDYFHGPDCCTSSGQRQISMLPRLFYAQNANSLFVNQFVASTGEFTVQGKRVTVRQATRYPEEESVSLEIGTDTPVAFALQIRLPAWCQAPDISVNGQRVTGLTAGTYAKIERKWTAGDKVQLLFPMRPQWVNDEHLDAAPWALTRGPVVYALDTAWWNEASAGAPAPKDVDRDACILRSVEPRILPTGPRSSGPFYEVALRIGGGAEVKGVMVPYCNIGRWYREGEPKPERKSKAFSYAVWLKDAEPKRP